MAEKPLHQPWAWLFGTAIYDSKYSSSRVPRLSFSFATAFAGPRPVINERRLGPCTRGALLIRACNILLCHNKIMRIIIRKNPVKCVSLRGSIRRFVLYEVEQVFKLTINAILNWLLSYSW